MSETLLFLQQNIRDAPAKPPPHPASRFQRSSRVVIDATCDLNQRVYMNAASHTRYEYKFVRLGEGLLSARSEARERYQEQIQQHAREGWRLVQVFAPGIGVYGAAKYYELILEREVSI